MKFVLAEKPRHEARVSRDDVSDNAFCHRELVTNFDNNCIASAAAESRKLVRNADRDCTVYSASAVLIINMCG